MSHTVDGNSDIGFRVIDDESGLPMSGRKPTTKDALDAAGIVEARKPRTKN
jgi:hypothetical protein